MLLAAANTQAQKVFGDLYPVDSIFFEHNTLPYFIDQAPLPQDRWQVGHPSKTFFNAAYSAPLAIVTDTVNPYGINLNCSFSFSFENLPYGASYLEFTHKYDSDTLNDYGMVEVSYDHGLNWTLLKDSTCADFSCVMLYWKPDQVLSTAQQINHIMYPSGHSNGWIRSSFIWWWWMAVDKNNTDLPPDSLYIRFTFHSDNIQNNKEGWMIDNIITGIMDIGSGVSQNQHDYAINISPLPLTAVSRVKFPENLPACDFIICDALGRILYNRNVQAGEYLDLHRSDFHPGIFFWSLRYKDQVVSSGKLAVI